MRFSWRTGRFFSLTAGRLLWAEPSPAGVQLAQTALHCKQTLPHPLRSYPALSSPHFRVGSPHHAWMTPQADGSTWKLGSNRWGSPHYSWLEVNPVGKCQLCVNGTQRSNVVSIKCSSYLLTAGPTGKMADNVFLSKTYTHFQVSWQLPTLWEERS